MKLLRELLLKLGSTTPNYAEAGTTGNSAAGDADTIYSTGNYAWNNDPGISLPETSYFNVGSTGADGDSGCSSWPGSAGSTALGTVLSTADRNAYETGATCLGEPLIEESSLVSSYQTFESSSLTSES